MNFSVTILGSSSALPTSNRFLTAQVLNVNERFFLIDCGEGTQIQLRRCKIKFGRINHIFISHLHGDHVFGLPGLISTYNLLGRKSDLHIYAHQPLKQILNQFLGQFYTVSGFNIIYHPINESGFFLIYEDKHIEVFSFPLKHRIACSGFLFREKVKSRNIKKSMIEKLKIPISEIVNIKQGSDFINDDGNRITNVELTDDPAPPRSYAFVTDTEYLPEIADIIQDVNVLYHESTYLNEESNLAKETGHSTAAQAAQIAKSARVSKLILGHYSSRYKDMTKFLEQSLKEFDHVVLSEDGKTYSI
jgi:ribonuclease Z